MTVTKYLDYVTPLLHKAAVEGKAFARVDITIVRDDDAGGWSRLVGYTLKDVRLTSVSVDGFAELKTVETLTLTYNSITWDFEIVVSGS